MRETLQTTISSFRSRPLAGLLGFSPAVFWYKGLQYAILGSFVPLILILVISVLLIFGAIRSIRLLKRTLLFWSLALILWSIIRLLLTMVHFAKKPIPEAHVAAQLDLAGVILSLFILLGGLLTWRMRRKLA